MSTSKAAGSRVRLPSGRYARVGTATAKPPRLGALLGTLLLSLALGTARPGGVMAQAAAKPAITNCLLATGTPFVTRCFVQDSGVAGPTVLITGGLHGNEPAGAAAADRIRQWPVTKGRLVVVPRANELALAAGRRNTPGVETNLGNLNRNFPKAGEVSEARGPLAQPIWALARECKPDWVIDLHEGYDFSQSNGKSVGSSIIPFPLPGVTNLVDKMIAAVNRTISEPSCRFVRRKLPVDGSLARAAGEHLHIPAMIIETTTKGQTLGKRVGQHEVMVYALLKELGMVSEPLAALQGAPAALPKSARIALYQGPGTGGAGPTNILKYFNTGTNVLVVPVTPAQIQDGILKRFAVVIFAGGSASKQAETLGETGRQHVRDFVQRGGGYVGICAGAYLATSGFPWSLRILNAKTASPLWRRGVGRVKIELTEPGRKLLGDRPGLLEVLYANGPILRPAESPELDDFEVLAYFRTELALNNTPVGLMENSPAIVAGHYGQGRVVCFSPHPEQTNGLESFVAQALNWIQAPRTAEALSQE